MFFFFFNTRAIVARGHVTAILITIDVTGGMCWGSMTKNGLCKDLLAERVSREKCCSMGGGAVSTSWSPADMDSGALFFWRVLGDGVPCTRCKGKPVITLGEKTEKPSFLSRAIDVF